MKRHKIQNTQAKGQCFFWDTLKGKCMHQANIKRVPYKGNWGYPHPISIHGDGANGSCVCKCVLSSSLPTDKQTKVLSSHDSNILSAICILFVQIWWFLRDIWFGSIFGTTDRKQQLSTEQWRHPTSALLLRSLLRETLIFKLLLFIYLF